MRNLRSKVIVSSVLVILSGGPAVAIDTSPPLLLTGFSAAAPQGNPGGIATGLNMWMQADHGIIYTVDDNLNVVDSFTGWMDTTHNIQFTEHSNAVGNTSVIPGGLNFHDKIQFVDGRLNSAAGTNITTAETYVVAEYDNQSDAAGLILGYSGANKYFFWQYSASQFYLYTSTRSYFTNTLPSAGPHVFSANVDGANRYIRFDGEIQNPAGSTSLSPIVGDPYLGNRGNGGASNFDGSISEVLSFDRTLDDTERQRVESYLALKYGITLNEDHDQNPATAPVYSNGFSPGDYVLSDNATAVRVLGDYAGYNHDIAGLVRDDASPLNQKISQSSNNDALVTFSLANNFVARNNDVNVRTAQLSDDLSGLTWGNNNAPIAWTETGAAADRKILERVWQVAEVGDTGSVFVSVPQSSSAETTKLPNDNGQVYLLISDDTNFTTNTTEIPLKKNGNNWELPANHSGVDLNNNQYFTFSTSPLDTDKDGVFDSFDVDADNDGVLNADEVTITDVLLDADSASPLFISTPPHSYAAIAHYDPAFNSSVAWVPLSPLSGDVYVGMMFDGPRGIKDVSTKGRGSYPQWITSYRLEATKDGSTWISLGDYDANTDQNTPVTNDVNNIEVDWIGLRIVPLTWSGHPSVRFQFNLVELTDTDTDGDSIPNYLDLDSDNDGIADVVESGLSGAVDGDNDGLIDNFNDGATVDGHHDGVAGTLRNTDTDTLVDMLDLDSDGDFIPDAIEARATGTSDVITATTDSDSDGVLDHFDTTNDGVFGGNFTDVVNTDGLDSPDYIDSDSDNDTDLDSAESGLSALPGDVSYADADGTVAAASLLTDLRTDTAEVAYREISADEADLVANIIAAANTGGTDFFTGEPLIIVELLAGSITGTVIENAELYEIAIRNAAPQPTTLSEVQAIIGEVNQVAPIVSAGIAAHTGGGGETALTEMATGLAGLPGMPSIPAQFNAEMAALIEGADPSPTTIAELIALANFLLERAEHQPVAYLTVLQGGVAVQMIRTDGGPVTIRAFDSKLAGNPAAGIVDPVYSWADTPSDILAVATEATPITRDLVIDPSAMAPESSFEVSVLLTRFSLNSTATGRVFVAPAGTTAAEVADSDADGVNDAFEGELEATINPEAINKIQSQANVDNAYVMTTDTGLKIRLGSIARAANANQASVTLDQIVEHLPGATTASVIDGLPHVGDAAEVEVFDFDVVQLPRVGYSVGVVIPLKAALRNDANYVKYTVSEGWTSFEENALNVLYSAPATGGVLGQCGDVADSVWTEGLTAGHQCIQIKLSDGGGNDADRIDAGGFDTVDKGFNGMIVDPGALVYTTPNTGALTNNSDGIEGGIGLGAFAFTGLLPLAAFGALGAYRRRRVAAAVSLAVLTTGTAQADAPDWAQDTYGSIGVLGSSLNPEGSSQGLIPSGDGGTGWRMAIGRRINAHWSAEVSYTDAGSTALKTENGGASSFPDAAIGYTAPALSAVWQLRPVIEQFNVFARGGVAMVKLKAQDTPENLDLTIRDDVHPTVGVGMSWRHSPRYSVALAHDVYAKDASWTSVGLVMDIGGSHSVLARAAQTAADASAVASAGSNVGNSATGWNATPIPGTGASMRGGCAAAQAVTTALHFHSGESRLLADDEAALHYLLASMPQGSDYTVQLTGYADTTGGTMSNQILSEQRAAQVAAALHELSVHTQAWDIDTQGLGETHQQTPEADAVERAENRRVDVEISCK